jgi:predicted murein hydrolase (TIGR00659 family)
MKGMLDSPIFGIIITIVTYEIGLLVYRRTKLSVLNPLLISMLMIISFLTIFKIDLGTYNIGGSFISVFLAPATVILAVPLYSKIEILKKNLKEILLGIAAGTAVSIISVLVLSKIMVLDKSILLSLIPKSITTPVGIELSKQLGGIPSITIAAILIAGITGAVIVPTVCHKLKIKDKVALGIALGTSAHAVGTSKAMEIGETEGAMSGLAIGITALMTVLIAPIILNFL